MTVIRFVPSENTNYMNEAIKRILHNQPENKKDLVEYPPVDISADENKIYIDCELPGMQKENISISIQNNLLTIKGKRSDNKQANRNFYMTERSYGEFTRKFTLPEDINRDTVDARFENGVLQLTIEKVVEKPVQDRVININ